MLLLALWKADARPSRERSDSCDALTSWMPSASVSIFLR